MRIGLLLRDVIEGGLGYLWGLEGRRVIWTLLNILLLGRIVVLRGKWLVEASIRMKVDPRTGPSRVDWLVVHVLVHL